VLLLVDYFVTEHRDADIWVLTHATHVHEHVVEQGLNLQNVLRFRARARIDF
jgi:hypothetical protein